MKAAQDGFSLLELMVVMAIAGILMAVAVPGFITTIRNNRLSSQTNEFIYALKFARTEALKRNIPVTVCRSSTQLACNTLSAGWEGGWIVFAENAGTLGTLNGATTFASGATLANPILRASDNRVIPAGTVLTASTDTAAETVLDSHEALTGGTTLRGNTNVVNRVTFNSQGMAPSHIGTIVLCDSRGGAAAQADAREIVISTSGQTRLTTPTSRSQTNPVTADPTTCTP
ncbi:MAG: GspH/FimT family pseudopilin [Pseudomonadota bacterium]